MDRCADRVECQLKAVLSATEERCGHYGRNMLGVSSVLRVC